MNNQSIDLAVEDILRLLVIIIAADSKILQEEIDSFIDVTVKMSLRDAIGNVLTKATLSDWFSHNCDAIRAESVGPEIEAKIARIFVRLQDWPDKAGLLEALRSVAASDGQYHLNEKVLITLAAAYWDMKSPAMN